MNVVATIQARMGSSRLPGKVLQDVHGKPLLMWHVERLKRSRLLDDVVVVTSDSSKDDPIEAVCRGQEVSFFRGSEDDVLDRVAKAIEKHNIDVHIETFGDSPLTDPDMVDGFVGYYIKHREHVDVVCNTLRTTYPPGMDLLVYAGNVLEEVNSFVPKDDASREHVGYNITRLSDRYRVESLDAPLWYRYPDMYLEVDTQEDLTVLSGVIGHFASQGKEHFTLSQIIDFLASRPDLMERNADVERRWKAFRESSD